jgi:TolB-like protein
MHLRSVAVPGTENPGLSFAGFRLEPDGTLLRGETPVHLPPKELAALRLLASHAGRIVTPLELRHALWGDVHVTDDSVLKCVSSLRSRLQPEDCIQTIYKRGYRFTPGVKNHGNGLGGGLPRLVILPFATGYGVPEHLGPVLAEETMARLTNSRPAKVSVLAQDSVFTLARRGLTAQQTGEALHADMVLAGTLSALPANYRLRAEMIRVEDGVQIWVEDVLVDRTRTAGLEAELSDRLVVRLGVWEKPIPLAARPAPVPAIETEPYSAQPLEDVTISAVAASAEEIALEQQDPQSRREAYEIFQRARHEWQTLQRHRMQDGLQHLLRATELDPELIDARVDLVNACVAQSIYGFMSPATTAEIARRATESISPPVSRADAALPALGFIAFYFDRNLPAALRNISLSAWLPHDPWTTRARSMLLLSRHRFGAAVDLVRGVIQQDPYSPWLQAHLAWILHLAGEAGESVEQAQRALKLFPEHESASIYGAIILAFNGEAARAVEIAHDLVQRQPYLDPAASVHAYALAMAGNTDEAGSILERQQWLSRERYLLKTFMPAAYVALGDNDAAILELRASEQNRCPWFFQMLADPRLKPLASRPEFEQMLGILAGMEAEAAKESVLES